ncbi:LysR family transcriptional regulator [Geobacillus zalihae]|uniref:LysR family transcriptional regulator n=1 Tax=Geobacillus zalihae TaxID=213419 RepID=UPI00261BA6B2|nr:LysR family transcriptional regulator [Geobacillus zalihae]WKA48412.1 LysR family transcriptional regulator [Geobacillus zalihae]
MEDRDWMILHTLYKEKSITKTAQRLFISQPTLTKRLQQIEKELEVKIVDRGFKGVQFTPEGEYLAKCAEDMLHRLRVIKENLKNFHHQVAGTLRLGVSNFISKYKLPALLKYFKDQYPQVEFQVKTGYSRDIFALLYSQEVHVAFIRGEYNWPDQKHLLFEENICIASKQEVDLEQLPQLPRIDYKTDVLYRQLVDNWWAERYIHPPYIAMVVDQGDTCKEMVANGLGYAIMPSLFLENVKGLHKICLTDKKGRPLTQKTWMMYHQDSLTLNVVNAFVDVVKQLDIYSL